MLRTPGGDSAGHQVQRVSAGCQGNGLMRHKRAYVPARATYVTAKSWALLVDACLSTIASQAAQQRAGGGRQTATERMQQRLRRRRQATAQAESGSGGEADEVSASMTAPDNVYCSIVGRY
jgi:hypothetical protein